MGDIINNFPEQSISTHNFSTIEGQKLVNREKLSINLSWEAQPWADVALVCNSEVS